MYVSGFTIARNVLKADYPIKEAIFSIIDLCDEVVVAVGNSDDGTLDYIKGFNHPKIRIVETVWDDNLRSGGRVLALETDKAKAAVNPQADWLFYIQADECLHEKDIPSVRAAMEKQLHNDNVDGLLFSYRHFYGSYDYLGDSRKWYRHEIRVIRNRPDIFSYRDAQGFRKLPNHKLAVVDCGAEIYHYGWVKHPQAQQQKQMQFHRLWHSDDYMQKHIAAAEFDYGNIDSLAVFSGTHPKVMHSRISLMNWTFDFDISRKRMGLKARFLHWIEQKTGWRVGEYRNFKKVRLSKIESF
jgi:glycosyltransferase involved in cell wall biosynthesis